MKKALALLWNLWLSYCSFITTVGSVECAKEQGRTSPQGESSSFIESITDAYFAVVAHLTPHIKQYYWLPAEDKLLFLGLLQLHLLNILREGNLTWLSQLQECVCNKEVKQWWMMWKGLPEGVVETGVLITFEKNFNCQGKEDYRPNTSNWNLYRWLIIHQHEYGGLKCLMMTTLCISSCSQTAEMIDSIDLAIDIRVHQHRNKVIPGPSIFKQQSRKHTNT